MNVEYDVDALISAIKKRKCIWNYNEKDYCNKTLKNRAWMEVVTEIIPDIDNKSIEEKNLIGLYLQQKWKNLKDAFTRHFKNAKKKSGSAASTPRVYPYSEQLRFLKDLSEERGSNISSIPLPSESSDCTDNVPTTSAASKGKRKLNNKEEDILLQKISKRFEDKINIEQQQVQNHDEDKLFLLSLLSDFKKIHDDHKLDAKAEIIQIVKKYRDSSINSSYNYSMMTHYPFGPSNPNNYYYGYSTVPPPPPDSSPQTTTTRPESQLSSYSYKSASTSSAPPETTSQLSLQSFDSRLSPESIIGDLFS